MTQRTLRRTAAALVLAAVFALAAPAQAAGRPGSPGSGWLEAALQWVTTLWAGGPSLGSGAKSDPGNVKSDSGHGIDSNGTSSAPQPQTKPNGDGGAGIDPNG
jgi:hypothetical protein